MRCRDIQFHSVGEAPSTLYNWRNSEIEGWDNKRFDTWAYKAFAPRPDMDKQLDKQIGKLAMITSKGGNFLLNIGPMADGTVLEYEQEVLAKHWPLDEGTWRSDLRDKTRTF